MTPGTHNFNVVRGTSGPKAGLVFQLRARDGDNEVNIPYEDVRISIYNKRGTEKLIRATIGSGIVVVDALTNTFAWVPTTVDTRLIPQKEEAAYYEIEVWNGTDELVYLHGYITGIGGVNDDIDGTNGDGDV